MRLYVRQKTENSIVLASREEGIEALVPRTTKMIIFTQGFLKGVLIEKPYHLKKENENSYKIEGTRYKLIKKGEEITLC